MAVRDEDSVSHTRLRGIHSGTWGAGSVRAEVRGTYAASPIEDTGERLLAAPAQHACLVPFAPGDRHELGLLDRAKADPLALLEDRRESRFLPTRRVTSVQHVTAGSGSDLPPIAATGIPIATPTAIITTCRPEAASRQASVSALAQPGSCLESTFF